MDTNRIKEIIRLSVEENSTMVGKDVKFEVLDKETEFVLIPKIGEEEPNKYFFEGELDWIPEVMRLGCTIDLVEYSKRYHPLGFSNVALAIMVPKTIKEPVKGLRKFKGWTNRGF